ncbi:MAG: hypothetical protein IPH66_10060 [Crocinitomicaceae bacterium]|nr:hypothetical protein [Crocinitomicaceae bacterium]
MQLAEIEQIKNDSQAPVNINSVFELYDYFVINDYVPIKVERVSNSFNTSNPVSISHNGIIQGYLIFLKEKGDVQISQMTEFEFISFLATAQHSDYNNISYKFETDFLLIKSDFFLDYNKDYLKKFIIMGWLCTSSSCWGSNFSL